MSIDSSQIRVYIGRSGPSTNHHKRACYLQNTAKWVGHMSRRHSNRKDNDRTHIVTLGRRGRCVPRLEPCAAVALARVLERGVRVPRGAAAVQAVGRGVVAVGEGLYSGDHPGGVVNHAGHVDRPFCRERAGGVDIGLDAVDAELALWRCVSISFGSRMNGGFLENLPAFGPPQFPTQQAA
jgi:hypothetical protein